MSHISLKKAAALVLALALAVSMSACGASSSSAKSQNTASKDAKEILVLKPDEPRNINGKDLLYTIDIDENDINGDQGEVYLSYGDNTLDLGVTEGGWHCDSYVVMTDDNHFLVYATVPDYEWRYTIPVVYDNGVPTMYESVSGSIESTEDITSADRCLLRTYMSYLGTYSVVSAYLMGENGLTPESSYVQIINEKQVEDGSYLDSMGDNTYRSCYDCDGRRILTLKTDLSLSTDRGDVTLPTGTVVYPIGFDTGSHQFYVEYDGGEGWFNFTESPKGYGCAINGLDEYDCFESLLYAG